MKIKVKRTKKYLRVYFNGILHVAIKHKNLSIQTWIKGEKVKWYYIELSGAKGSEWMKYDNQNVWAKLIRKLDNSIK